MVPANDLPITFRGLLELTNWRFSERLKLHKARYQILMVWWRLLILVVQYFPMVAEMEEKKPV